MSFNYQYGLDWMRDLLEIAYKFDFIHRVNNVTYQLINLETGEVYRDANGNELTGKRKFLEDYLANNYEFQNEYLNMLNRYITASDDCYGNILDAREQAEKRSFDHYLIPRFTNYLSTDSDKTITDHYRDLVNHEARNEWIIQDIRQVLEQRRTPLILTERREHVQLLAQRLSPFCKNIILLFGTPSQKERRETLERLRAIPDTEPLLLIATGKYVGEGFDYPRLDTLFLTLPISWKGKVAQYAGRLHRNYPDKKEVQIYDYVDLHVPMLETMYQRRLKGYAAIGYKLKTDSATDAAPDLIYDGKSFFPVYCRDLRNAMQSIQILSPFLRKTRVREIAKHLVEPLSKGAVVTVITRPPEDFPENNRHTVEESTELLRKAGVQVQYRSAFHQKYTIIDGRTVWYGSINFLSFGASEESIMRFTNRDIALQLTETITANN